MKPLIAFLLFILVSVPVYPQCNWEKEGKYPFTGVISRSSIWETITRTLFSTISFQIVEFEKDSSMHLNVKVDLNRHYSTRRCFDDKSRIIIKSGDSLMTINMAASTNQGNILTSYGNILSKDVDFLRHNLIDMVRICFDKGYDDYKIRDHNSIIPLSKYSKSKNFKTDYFIRTLKCF
jgi:hypothetical protein